MTYPEFFHRFGGSYRAKAITEFPAGLFQWIRWIVGLLRGRREIFNINKRFFAIPNQSGIPKEFIRLDPWEGEYLFIMASRSRHCIVEIGRFLGGSTFLLAAANPNVAIYSIDLAPRDDETLRKLLDAHGLGANVELIVGDSQRGEFPQIPDIDCLFIDGDHSYQGCSNDLELWYPKVLPGGHVLLHDSYFGCDVQDAIADFIHQEDPRVIVPPFIGPYHWHGRTGSMAHLTKKK
jgi:predicted O-methyltransferase YrrM